MCRLNKICWVMALRVTALGMSGSSVLIATAITKEYVLTCAQCTSRRRVLHHLSRHTAHAIVLAAPFTPVMDYDAYDALLHHIFKQVCVIQRHAVVPILTLSADPG